MELVATRVAAQLTGLSPGQLREWTIRRALIPADLKPKAHGSPARYSWQTLLLLRLALTFRDKFKIELEAHRDFFSKLRLCLSESSFQSLLGKSLVFENPEKWSLIHSREPLISAEDCVVVKLDPHLAILSKGFPTLEAGLPKQFRLFQPISSVKKDLRLPMPFKVRNTGPNISPKKLEAR